MSPALTNSSRVRMSRFTWICLAVILAVWFLILALTRRVDADEGYFLYAARMVLEGNLPYRDFFYPQMPLMPYLYATLLWPTGGVEWVPARIAAACIAVVVTLLFARLLSGRLRRRSVALTLLAVYLFSDIGLEWSVAIKIYTPTLLWLLLAWLPLPRWADDASAVPARFGRGAIFSGLCAGLAVATRLTVAPVLFIMLAVWVWEARRRGQPWRLPATAWLAGGLIALVPVALLALAAPLPFFFDNWTYHSLGGPDGFGRRMLANIPAMFKIVLSEPLWLGALALLVWERLRHRRSLTAADGFYRLAFAVMILVSILPIRVFRQYICLGTPFLLLAAAPAFESFVLDVWRPLWTRTRWKVVLPAILAIIMLAIQPFRVIQGRWSGRTIPDPARADATTAYDERLATLMEIERVIDSLSTPDTKFFSWWPGYALSTSAQLVPGMENHFGQRVSKYASDDICARVHVATIGDVERMIHARELDLVVVGIWAGMESWRGRAYYERMLEEAGYRPVERVGATAIYRLSAL